MTDIMVQEALRTALTGAIDQAVYGPGGTDEGAAPDYVAAKLLDLFPEVEWEFTTNENGAPVRRLAVKGEWIVDLMPAVERAPTSS
jgi:hypothetical protein